MTTRERTERDIAELSAIERDIVSGTAGSLWCEEDLGWIRARIRRMNKTLDGVKKRQEERAEKYFREAKR